FISRLATSLLLVLDFLELGVDDVVVTGLLLASAAGLLAGLGVHLLGQLVRSLRKRLHLLVDGVLVVALHDLAQVGDGLLDVFLLAGLKLVAVFLQRLLGSVDQAVRLIAGVDQRARLAVLLGVRL